jgi:hypothetical protein
VAKKVEDTIAATSGFPGVGGLGKPEDPDDQGPPAAEDKGAGESEESTISFPIPSGFEPPAGVKQGDEFTALASLRMGEEGDIHLTKIDGIPVTGESEDEDEETSDQKGEQNKPGATGAEGAIPSSGNTAIASVRGALGEMGMPA